MERIMVISSDGHAMARMADYRPYIPSSHIEEFDEFLAAYEKEGVKLADAASMQVTHDVDVIEQWVRDVIDPGRLEGTWNLDKRLGELEQQGICAEVLFPDFGLPFELYLPLTADVMGYSRRPDQIEVGNMAHNRWLADFVSAAPERFAGLAVVDFEVPETAIAQIHWAKEAGLKGIVLQSFDETSPLFHPRYDPIWSVLAETGMVVNCHTATTSTSRYPIRTILPESGVPHPSVAVPIYAAELFFFTQNTLNHMIWGGVLERHPNLKVVFTEQQSAWVVQVLRHMDWVYDGSYQRRDVREVLSMKPSDYFDRQCYLGSSVFSEAEVRGRHEIGLHQMMIGMDYPHFEGTWGQVSTTDYLQATFGPSQVPEDEARLLLGETAAEVYGFDVDALRPLAERIGPLPSEILTAPPVDKYPRGDVHRPFVGVD